MKTGRQPLAGSQPEEQYAPATREKMFLDRPTSHGGWPEGEYDPPVKDRIYGWYKKMKMMPEGDEPTMRSVRSSEQRRDLQKGRYGHRLGYQQDPESQELARDLALRIMSPGERGDALDEVMQNPHLAMNVWSELQSEGEYELAKLVRPIADGYVAQRGKHMRITESMLRRIIREEYSRMNEAENAEAVKHCKTYLKSNREKDDLSKLAKELKTIKVTEMTEISAALDAANSQLPKNPDEIFSDQAFDGIAGEIVSLQKSMKEGQRGNDENSQHDNDTDPGDPYAKKLKESRRLALRRAVLAEMRRRGII